MSTLKQLAIIFALLALAAVFGASLYQSVIEAPNFNANLPDSLEHYRQFMSAKNPGDYFRILAPAAQIFTLLSLILNWKSPLRWWLFSAFAFIAVGDVITFNIHYPRNALMFTAPLTVSVDVLWKAAAEWMIWNHVRVALVLGSTLCTIKALMLVNNRKIA